MPTPQLYTYFKDFTTDNLGRIIVAGPLKLEAYSKVNVQIMQFPQVAVSMTVNCSMGRITPPSLSQYVEQFPLTSSDPPIHTYDVIGPEFMLLLTGGPPNTTVPIQAWIFIH
jgi:hypothetical protein